jgi:hypothetical protein
MTRASAFRMGDAGSTAGAPVLARADADADPRRALDPEGPPAREGEAATVGSTGSDSTAPRYQPMHGRKHALTKKYHETGTVGLLSASSQGAPIVSERTMGCLDMGSAMNSG